MNVNFLENYAPEISALLSVILLCLIIFFSFLQILPLYKKKKILEKEKKALEKKLEKQLEILKLQELQKKEGYKNPVTNKEIDRLFLELKLLKD